MTINNKLSLPNYKVGDLILSNYKEIHTNANISNGVLDINLNQGNVFLINLNTNITTINISNVPNLDNIVVAFTMIITTSGSNRTISWPSSIKWPANTAPVITIFTGKKDFFSFVTTDKGLNWFGFIGGQNY
jgi:hypothetical protein